MSRIGRLPISIPASVTVMLEGRNLNVKGPKGELTVPITNDAKLDITDDIIAVTPANDTRSAHQKQGLTRTLIQNAVTGVTDSFSKRLEIRGVGYRAQVSGNKVTLSLGFSHPIEFVLPEGVSADMEDNNVLAISGIDRQAVGQVAAEIRALKKPEPYKGKGIRYQNEWVRHKVGKAASK